MSGPRRFPETQWTQILRAGDPHHPTSRAALEALCTAYWRPAFLYIRAAGRLDDDDASDVAQAFFARFIERRQVEQLDPDTGSFRGFLKRSIKNFLIDQARRRTARTPQGKSIVPLEASTEGDALLSKLGAAEQAFEQEWTRTVLTTALSQLEKQLGEVGLSGHFETFRAYLLPDDASSDSGIDWQRLDADAPRRTYQEVADRLGKTHGAVRKHLELCRRELRSLVRKQVEATVGNEAELEAEFRKIVGG